MFFQEHTRLFGGEWPFEPLSLVMSTWRILAVRGFFFLILLEKWEKCEFDVVGLVRTATVDRGMVKAS